MPSQKEAVCPAGKHDVQLIKNTKQCEICFQTAFIAWKEPQLIVWAFFSLSEEVLVTLKLAKGFLAQSTSVTVQVQSRFSVHKLLQYLNINHEFV